jgi:hypothetical protein
VRRGIPLGPRQGYNDVHRRGQLQVQGWTTIEATEDDLISPGHTALPPWRGVHGLPDGEVTRQNARKARKAPTGPT